LRFLGFSDAIGIYSSSGEQLDWVICLRRREHEAIGRVELRRDDGSRDQRGFRIAPELQRQGLMMEAAEAVTAYAFMDLKWPHLWLVNAEANVASHRIKEKQGATLVDRVRKRCVSGEGVGELWLLTRDAWLSRNGR